MAISGAPSIFLDPTFSGEVELPKGPPPELADAGGPGRWPRMLVLDPDVEQDIKMFLQHEIHLCWQEKEPLIDDWIQWQKDYWAKPAQKVRNFPFKRAANVVIPITAIAVEAIYARMLNTLFSVKPFWSIRPRTPDWIEAAPSLERWLQRKADDPSELDIYGFTRDSLLELIKLGTAVGKSGYERDIRKTIVPIGGGQEEERWITLRNGATLDYVPVANFLMRLHEKDPQKAAWVGEEHRFTWSQLKRMALAGRISADALESVKSWWWASRNTQSPGQKYEEAVDKQMNIEPAWHAAFDVQEIWLSYDVDKDGIDEEIVLDFHYDSLTILSARYNWYDDLHRPYRICPFIPVEGRWPGIGVGKQNEQFQPLITAIHRQRLDAGTLANMGQIALKKTSGYGPGEPIFPGKIWFLDDVNDIREFHLSDPHHVAQLNNEEAARAYSDKRTGVNEVILGLPHEGTPGTATSDLARLAEGNKKFDAALRNVRRWLSLLGQDVLANYQQFGDQNLVWVEQTKDGQWVRQILNLPTESVRQGAIVDLTVTDSITNRDVEQQKWMSLFAVLTQHYDKAIERAMLITNVTQDPTALLALAQSALLASNEATKRLLETFNVPDIETFLLSLGDLNARPVANPAPTLGGYTGPDQTSRILQLAQSARDGSGGPSDGVALR